MPEGDTIHKVAARMRPTLLGQPVAQLRLRERGVIDAVAGQNITAIDAIGKHLVIRFGEAWGLRVHLGMKGRWRQFRRGAPWDWSPAQAVVVLVSGEHEFVCFRASQAELMHGVSLTRNRHLLRLGPDLLAPEVDFAAILERARARQTTAIGELLLAQSVACGIGNVYKSEVMFLHRVHPWTATSALGDEALEAMYRDARRLMQANLGETGRRITVDEPQRRPARREMLPRLYVYGRHRKPCLRCNTFISVRRQGDEARTTYWCARCQPRRDP